MSNAIKVGGKGNQSIGEKSFLLQVTSIIVIKSDGSGAFHALCDQTKVGGGGGGGDAQSFRIEEKDSFLQELRAYSAFLHWKSCPTSALVLKSSFNYYRLLTDFRSLSPDLSFFLQICITTKIVQRCTIQEKESAEFTQSILMAQVPLMCSVTSLPTVGGGQCSKRD